ncbi:MAG: hypothetical protein AB7G28_01560 [Pirellulales bacterium]
MFENRISEQFQFAPAPSLQMNVATIPSSVPTAITPAQRLLPTVTMQDLYQMAAAKAQYDYELDKLFNPDYYGDGSGI